MLDLRFAWRVCQYVKSNAIVFARAGATIGVGAGQMSRVYSTRIAALKATDEKLEIAGAVMASDAYFPFRDGLEAAASLGIRRSSSPAVRGVTLRSSPRPTSTALRWCSPASATFGIERRRVMKA